MGTINCKNNHGNLTYRQLKEMVPATPKGRMPRATTLHETPILFSEEIDGATIVVYENGYLTYTADDCLGAAYTTVYSVHKCSNIVYQTGCSKSEFNEECGSYGEYCKLVYNIINGQRTRFAIVNENAYIDGPWWFPIVAICEERLLQSANERFGYRNELRDEDDFDDSDLDDPEAWLEAEIENINQAMDYNRLMAALDTLTDIQYKTIKMYFGNSIRRPKELEELLKQAKLNAHDGQTGQSEQNWQDNPDDTDDNASILNVLYDMNDNVTDSMTERKVAEIFGTTQQNVHKNLQAALKRLRKNFFK